MRCLVLCCFVSACWAQSTTYAPVLASAGYLNPSLLPVAPGQLLTLFVQPAPSDANPTVSAVFWNGSDQPMPVQQVQRVGVCPSLSNPSCAQSLAVTVEIPFGIPVLCPLCENPIQAQGSIAVSVNGVKSSYVDVQPLQDQVHFLTACDIVVSGSATPLFVQHGLALLTHHHALRRNGRLRHPPRAGRRRTGGVCHRPWANQSTAHYGATRGCEHPYGHGVQRRFQLSTECAGHQARHCRCSGGGCAFYWRHEGVYRSVPNQFRCAAPSSRVIAVRGFYGHSNGWQCSSIQPYSECRLELFVRRRRNLR